METMQDKETKKRFENFVTEECGDSLWGNDGTDNYDTAYDVKDKVWGFISKLEQEAERRGYEKGKEETEISTIGELMLNNSPSLIAPEGVVYLATYLQGFNRATELLVSFYGLSNEELSKGLRNYFKPKLLEEENGKQNAR